MKEELAGKLGSDNHLEKRLRTKQLLEKTANETIVFAQFALLLHSTAHLF